MCNIMKLKLQSEDARHELDTNSLRKTTQITVISKIVPRSCLQLQVHVNHKGIPEKLKKYSGNQRKFH